MLTIEKNKHINQIIFDLLLIASSFLIGALL